MTSNGNSKWGKAKKVKNHLGLLKAFDDAKNKSENDKPKSGELPGSVPSAPSSARSNEGGFTPGKWKTLQSKLLMGNQHLSAMEPEHPSFLAPRLDLPNSRPQSAKSTHSRPLSARSNSYSSRPSSRQGYRPSSAYIPPPTPKPPVKEKFINLKDRFDIDVGDLKPVGLDKMDSFKYVHIFLKIWEPQLCKSYRKSAVYTPPPRRVRSHRHRHEKYHGGLGAFLSIAHLSRKYSTSSVKSSDTIRSDRS